VYWPEPHFGQCPNAAAASLIAPLEAISGSDSGTTGLDLVMGVARPRGATLKPAIGLRTADLGTRHA
jgi:hypothetical protein